MYIGQPRCSLFPRILKSLVISLFLEFGQFCVEKSFLFQQMVSPNVGFQHRAEGRSIVANNLLEFNVTSEESGTALDVLLAPRTEL